MMMLLMVSVQRDSVSVGTYGSFPEELATSDGSRVIS